MNISNDDQCSCGESDSPQHVLFECPKYSELTNEFTDMVRERNLDEPSWLGEDVYREFGKVIRELLHAKETTERIERGEAL